MEIIFYGFWAAILAFALCALGFLVTGVRRIAKRKSEASRRPSLLPWIIGVLVTGGGLLLAVFLAREFARGFWK